jgi:putative endonuclease
MFTTYVLLSKVSRRLYTGSTSDLERRLEQHNADVSTSTKNRGPWQLVHQENFLTLAEAVRRERYLKTGKGREELKQILNANPAPSCTG